MGGTRRVNSGLRRGCEQRMHRRGTPLGGFCGQPVHCSAGARVRPHGRDPRQQDVRRWPPGHTRAPKASASSFSLIERRGAKDGTVTRMICLSTLLLAMLLVGVVAPYAAPAADLSAVALFDGERGELINNWGGAWSQGDLRQVRLVTKPAKSGGHALSLQFGPTAAGQQRYTQCLASGFGRTAAHRQTRDLSRYERLQFDVLNAGRVALTGCVQIKDQRDALAQRAVYRFPLPATGTWEHVAIPLDLTAAGWNVDGTPDLSQVLALDFSFAPHGAVSDGEVLLDDVVLTERGGPLPIETAPLNDLVERLARRQWQALWNARSRRHGLIPNNSYQSTDAGMNTTAGLLWMLPAAVRHQWVTQAEADAYLRLLLGTLDQLLAGARHLPPRNVDWATLHPSLLPEESSVDAAFLALALHQYKSSAATPEKLRQSIDDVQERFDFSAFACASGWRMAYRYATPAYPAGLVEWIYNGYTNEANVVSLAAHLSRRHHVPIETYWTTSTQRVRTQLAGFQRTSVVHASKDFRAPFTQALINLFVDVRQRGIDIYPDSGLATNPWQNFVEYEQAVLQQLAASGRSGLVQPDAGDDGSLLNYQQFSLYENFGQRDLFMPWSAAFPLLAGVDGGPQALRFLLQHGLHGPLGLADSAKWKTGDPRPYFVTARHDFWNTALSTMALLEWLDGDGRTTAAFANLPEVRAALDRVFRSKTPPLAHVMGKAA